MKAFSDDLCTTKSSTVSEENTLPLIVIRNKGSCYNNQQLPSKMLIDNNQMFASNYARPEIVFAHPSI